MRIVVIGGDACGASAAAGAKRALGDDAEVIVLERQPWTSYSACGIPYWMAGEVDGPDGLVARTPEQHRANGLDLRTGWTVTAIDVAGRSVTATTESGGDEQVAFDQLVIGTGAVPIRPSIPGIDLPGVHGVQTLDDGLRVQDSMHRDPQRAVVIGAGYIGIEMAEAMKRRGLEVTVVDQASQPMTTLDPDMGALIAQAMEGMGISYRGGEPVQAIEAGDGGRAAAVVTEQGTYPADIVVLGLGVRPNTDLAAAAGLPLGEFGGLLTDDRMQVLDHPGIWAGGDCVEVVDRITGRRLHIPLGTHANKHGRVIAANVAGGDLRFPGVVGTAVSKICELEISRVGLREQEARDLGFDVVSATIRATTKAHYATGAGPIHVKAVAERGSGRLLGCQIVGRAGAGKRIDAAAVAIWNEMTVEAVTSSDLAYAPPFSPVWDPVQIATRKLTSLV
ncbi:MAG: FAD-dependent oxidoreductase [Actinobacteria bacterium]|nr:FAD-dependent oxidoreductase [Actinomycetota bacterium]